MNPPAYRVAVEAPLPEALTYLPPPDGVVLNRGQSVRVPLGKRQVHGVVVRHENVLPSIPLKPVEALDIERPTLHEPFLHWTEWLSRYYFFPHGLIFDSVFPPLARHGRARKPPPVPERTPDSPPKLTAEQSACLAGIRAHSGFQTHLLFGVTGSGKTEVYLQLIGDVLKKNQQALVLVPEIALTPQLIDRFSRRFGGRIAVIHSHLTEREKTDQWWSVVSKEKSILIGARSALFCPIEDLGLIIVDEEHEPSYKQEEKLKYHARDAAIMLARFIQCPIVLGSATPSLESWKNVKDGKYVLHEMKNRVAERLLPSIEVIDLKEERERRRDEIVEIPFWMSNRLLAELQATLAKNEQAALFLNRRGVAPMAQCPECGHVEECPNCAVSLTVHKRTHLVCHYCGYTQPLAKKCPECKDGDLTPLGIGTELVETDLAKLFPQARIARADRDEIQTRLELEDMIQRMEKREIDILVGTQMIAKGLDFPHLTLVGLVMADVGFHWPDFRASERSFQLLTQMSGRAGRHSEERGRVIVQTYNPYHPSIIHTMDNSFARFADAELETRQNSDYPPYLRLALIRINGSDVGRTQTLARNLAHRASAITKARTEFQNLRVLGPAPAPLAKLRNRFRFHILIKSPSSQLLHAFCSLLLSDKRLQQPGTKVQVDIDPLHML